MLLKVLGDFFFSIQPQKQRIQMSEEAQICVYFFLFLGGRPFNQMKFVKQEISLYLIQRQIGGSHNAYFKQEISLYLLLKEIQLFVWLQWWCCFNVTLCYCCSCVVILLLDMIFVFLVYLNLWVLQTDRWTDPLLKDPIGHKNVS